MKELLSWCKCHHITDEDKDSVDMALIGRAKVTVLNLVNQCDMQFAKAMSKKFGVDLSSAQQACVMPYLVIFMATMNRCFQGTRTMGYFEKLIERIEVDYGEEVYKCYSALNNFQLEKISGAFAWMKKKNLKADLLDEYWFYVASVWARENLIKDDNNECAARLIEALREYNTACMCALGCARMTEM